MRDARRSDPERRYYRLFVDDEKAKKQAAALAFGKKMNAVWGKPERELKIMAMQNAYKNRPTFNSAERLKN